MNPTEEQVIEWLATTHTPVEFAEKAYQTDRAAALEELRGGGVELPEPLYTSSHRSYGESYSQAQLLDYGDRRAAVAIKPYADFIDEFITAWEEGMGGDSSLYLAAKKLKDAP